MARLIASVYSAKSRVLTSHLQGGVAGADIWPGVCCQATRLDLECRERTADARQSKFAPSWLDLAIPLLRVSARLCWGLQSFFNTLPAQRPRSLPNTFELLDKPTGRRKRGAESYLMIRLSRCCIGPSSHPFIGAVATSVPRRSMAPRCA
jgi:hypothetical protein